MEKIVRKDTTVILKENGFNEETQFFYKDVDGDDHPYERHPVPLSLPKYMEENVGHIPAPSHQTVLEWMRVKKDMFISITPYSDEEREMLELPAGIKYQWNLYFDSNGDIRPYEGRGKTVEETIEDAVSHCLQDAID